MVKYALAIAVSLVASVASAQPIHGHPQKAAYASPAEWLTPSGQCHWTQQGAPLDIAGPQSSHIHLDLTHPYGAEVTAPFVAPFALTLHHTAGVVGNVFGLLIRDITWDATGTTERPAMVGDPTGDRVFTGHLTVDPVTPVMGADGQVDPLRSPPPRGWFSVSLVARVYFDSGDLLEAGVYTSLYSTRDPSAPERPARASGHIFNIQCAPFSARLDDPRGSQFGTAVSEYSDWLPVAPIQTPWIAPGFLYNYAADPSLPIGSFEQRLDANFHLSIPGLIVRPPVALNGNQSFATIPITFDPAVMGTGAHKTLLAWTQPRGVEQLSALVVWPVTVGPGVPPPTLCTDPTATNVGGPLPCTFPPPVTSWTTFPALFQRFGVADRYRLCVTVDHCVELVIKP